MLSRVTCALIALTAFSQILKAQENKNTASTLERLAARAAVERALGGKLAGVRIVVNPIIVRANEAPGGTDSTSRDSDRNGSLVAALGARSLPRASVVECPARGSCWLNNADLFVTLAQPTISGEEATVTVTTLQRTKAGTPNKTQYKTVNVLLKRTGAKWEVVGFKDLGIS